MLSENDQKEQLSYAYVHAICSSAGFSCEKTTMDRDSIDTRVFAKGKLRDSSKYMSPSIELQLKATCDLSVLDDNNFSFPLSIKNYNELRQDSLAPRYLIVFDMPLDKTQWLTSNSDSLVKKRCAYWMSLRGRPDVTNLTSITIHIPKANIFNVDAVTTMLVEASEMRNLI